MAKPAKAPLIIAHRGASGYLPEHSLPAKALAYGMGADYLEQDIVASRDGKLLVLHDLWLDDVSDVAERFPGRHRDDGRHYCIDFDLDEIRTLNFLERMNPETGKQKHPERFPRSAGGFPVVTLDEEILFVRALNAGTGREIGIYPEIKEPRWHAEQGIDLTTLVIDALDSHGLLEAGSRIYLQCFDDEALKTVRRRTGPALPLIQLLSSRMGVDDAMLDEIAGYANGIGPSMKLILRQIGPDGRRELSDLAAEARRRELEIHPYTFRADDLPSGCNNLETLLDIFINDIGIDALFTDFPDRVAKFIRAAP